jgi:hypothetical protein
MRYKYWIICFLSLSIEARQPEKLVLLLDQVNEAQAYWEIIARDKKLSLWKRPPQTWFANYWNSTVPTHQKYLAQQHAELIQALALLSENPKALSSPTFSRLHKQTTLVLHEHGAPSHFKRRWLSYAAITTGIAALAFYLHHFKQTHTLFIIPPQNYPLTSSLEDFSPFSGLTFVANPDGTQYLQVKKTEEPMAQQFLADKHIIALKNAPQLSLCWQNEQGENKIKEFVRKHGINPLKEIYKILKNEDQPETKVLTTDIKRNEELYEKALTKVLVNATEVEQTTKIMQENLKGKSVHTLSLPEKQTLFADLTGELGDLINTQIKEVGEFIRTENQRIHDSKQKAPLFSPTADNPRLPEFARKTIIEINSVKETVNDFKKLGEDLGAEAKKYVNVVNYLTEHHPGFAGLTLQIFATIAFELKLKEAAFTHIAQGVAQDAQLNIELSKMIPFFLVTYLGYVGMKSIYHHAAALTIVSPLKRDLLSLQLILNKERHTKNCVALSKDFKGECFYWIQRLHRYQDKLPAAYRALYRRYLDELENPTLTPEQKMTLVTCLFHELDSLFKKDSY